MLGARQEVRPGSFQGCSLLKVLSLGSLSNRHLVSDPYVWPLLVVQIIFSGTVILLAFSAPLLSDH